MVIRTFLVTLLCYCTHFCSAQIKLDSPNFKQDFQQQLKYDSCENLWSQYESLKNSFALIAESMGNFAELAPAITKRVKYRVCEKGTVTIKFIINRTGKAQCITVVKGLSPETNNIAIEEVQKTIFKPARQNGHPVDFPCHLPIRLE